MIIRAPSGWNTGRARIAWNTAKFTGWNANYAEVQAWLDSEVLRGSNFFIPVETGMLKTSGVIATTPGSGVVAWRSRYARRQYYLFNRKTSRNINPNFDRGEPRWFHRWKASYGTSAVNSAIAMLKKGI